MFISANIARREDDNLEELMILENVQGSRANEKTPRAAELFDQMQQAANTIFYNTSKRAE